MCPLWFVFLLIAWLYYFHKCISHRLHKMYPCHWQLLSHSSNQLLLSSDVCMYVTPLPLLSHLQECYNYIKIVHYLVSSAVFSLSWVWSRPHPTLLLKTIKPHPDILPWVKDSWQERSYTGTPCFSSLSLSLQSRTLYAIFTDTDKKAAEKNYDSRYVVLRRAARLAIYNVKTFGKLVPTSTQLQKHALEDSTSSSANYMAEHHTTQPTVSPTPLPRPQPKPTQTKIATRQQ